MPQPFYLVFIEQRAGWAPNMVRPPWRLKKSLDPPPPQSMRWGKLHNDETFNLGRWEIPTHFKYKYLEGRGNMGRSRCKW
jgi:hypothetical protein